MNDRLTRNHYEMFGLAGFETTQSGDLLSSDWGAKTILPFLASNKIADLAPVLMTERQCLPLYRYTPEGERVSNITEWGLRQFRERYGDDSISAEDVFAYTYGVLHDPVYREKYAVDLLREFPRLPFYPEFRDWVKMGRELVGAAHRVSSRRSHTRWSGWSRPAKPSGSSCGPTRSGESSRWTT